MATNGGMVELKTIGFGVERQLSGRWWDSRKFTIIRMGVEEEGADVGPPPFFFVLFCFHWGIRVVSFELLNIKMYELIC